MSTAATVTMVIWGVLNIFITIKLYPFVVKYFIGKNDRIHQQTSQSVVGSALDKGSRKAMIFFKIYVVTFLCGGFVVAVIYTMIQEGLK